MPTETIPPLVVWDWVVIVAFFVISLGIGLYFSRRAVQSMTDYFVAGRKMTWWVAGTSIVATSFAADTPLVLAGWMRTEGIEKNWFWWGGIMGMMLCTFFFARMWRRADVLTDVEFNELRYGGAPAAGLRMFHASYRAVIANTLTMAWVTLAMTKILEVTLDIPTLVFLHDQWAPVTLSRGQELANVVGDLSRISQWPLIGDVVLPAKITSVVLCFVVAVVYTVVSGLWGVMAADFFQFIFAMTGSVVLMIAVLIQTGGPTSMVEQARAALADGQVHNKVADIRGRVDREALLAAIAVAGTELEDGLEAAARNHAARQIIEKLVGAGVLQDEPSHEYSTLENATLDGSHPELPESSDDSSDSDVVVDKFLAWDVDGYSELQVKKRLDDLGIDAKPVEVILGQWKAGYTVSKRALSESVTVKKLLDEGLLVEGYAQDDMPVDHYRFTSLSMTEDSLIDRLNTAGIEDKSEILSAWRGDKTPPSFKITSFLPPMDTTGGAKLAIWTLIVFLGLQWWAGGEGGGFLAQRLFSCKNEKHAVGAMLWFNLANFALRPWPWIVVGVASLFLIPDITRYGATYNEENAYAVMLMLYLPVGLKGMMVAALMAAYMSTISTHVNFGASYIVNDIYKRFVSPEGSEREYVAVSQVASLVLALFAIVLCMFITSIGGLWLTFFELMSGAGIVVLLRWYWWRINAWSELSAMFSSLMFWGLLNYTTLFHRGFEMLGMPRYYLEGTAGYGPRFTINLLFSTLIWLTVTFLTPPEKEEHLVRFYRRVRPAGWWNHIARLAGNEEHLVVGWVEWACWALGVTGLFAMIFALGKLCFGFYASSLGFAAYAAVATFLLFILIGKIDWSSSIQDEPQDPQTAHTDSA